MRPIILERRPTEREGSWDERSVTPCVEICTAIDRFQERTPDLSVSEVLAALGEVSSALACAGAPKRQSRPNVVSFSDYKRSTLTRTMTKDIDTLAGH